MQIDLPPGYRLVTLREVGDAFAHARTHAAEVGAGTLVFVGRFDLAEFAVVLEPEEPLRTARRAFYAGMAAMADALVDARAAGEAGRVRLARRDPRQPWPGRRRTTRAGLTGRRISRRSGWCSAA